MRIRFLLMDAYSAGGTIRTTYNTASCLARRHDVEIVSVYQRRAVARIYPDPLLPVRALSREVGTAQGEGAEGPRRLMAVLGKAPSWSFRCRSVATGTSRSGPTSSSRDTCAVCGTECW